MLCWPISVEASIQRFVLMATEVVIAAVPLQFCYKRNNWLEGEPNLREAKKQINFADNGCDNYWLL